MNNMIVDSGHGPIVGGYGSNRPTNLIMGGGIIDMKLTILEMMKELHKTNKFIHKMNLHQALAERVD